MPVAAPMKYLRSATESRAPVDQENAVSLGPKSNGRGNSAKACANDDGVTSNHPLDSHNCERGQPVIGNRKRQLGGVV